MRARGRESVAGARRRERGDSATYPPDLPQKENREGRRQKSAPAVGGTLQFLPGQASFTGLSVFVAPSVLSPVVDEAAKSIHSLRRRRHVYYS